MTRIHKPNSNRKIKFYFIDLFDAKAFLNTNWSVLKLKFNGLFILNFFIINESKENGGNHSHKENKHRPSSTNILRMNRRTICCYCSSSHNPLYSSWVVVYRIECTIWNCIYGHISVELMVGYFGFYMMPRFSICLVEDFLDFLRILWWWLSLLIKRRLESPSCH